MKNPLFILVFCSATVFAQVPQQKLYINLNSHNETSDGAYDGGTSTFYMTYYTKVKELADSVIRKKARWNFQSDFKFLLGALKWDPKNLSNTVSGNNLNLVKWMDDSYYIECDPHSHEGTNFGKQMTYADVAHLHDSLGCQNRRNVGGFKWDGLQNGSDWQDFENGMACVTYTWAPDWKPYTMWGGSYSSGVHNDLNSYGVWKPSGNVTATFFVHNTNRRVRNQGNGCELHFTDTTVDSRITSNVRDYATKVANGTFPAGNFYTQSLQIDVRDFNQPNFISRVCAILDTVNHLVAEGKAVWATISQKDSIWLADLDSLAFISSCATVTSGMSSFINETSVKLFPNPASTNVSVSVPDENKLTLTICNTAGQECGSYILNGKKEYELDLTSLPKGIYFLKMYWADGKNANLKMIRTE